jgi:hypothetical protein
VGGLICCWDDGSVNGNLGPRQWGVVDSQRRPKAVAYHIRKAFAPVRLALGKSTMEAGSLQTLLRVTNSYTFTDLAGFEFRWEWRGKDGTLTSGKNQYRVPPGREESFPLRVSAPREGECLRITVFDPQGFSVQNENFLLSPGAAPAAVGKALGLRGKWVPGAGMRLWDSKGEELLTIAGIVLEQAKSREENQPYGDVHYEPGDGNRVPFTIRRSDAILATGTLRFESGPNWMRIQYELTPVRDLQAREIGLRLKLGDRWSHLTWDRDALWSSVPEGWLDGPRGRAPLHALAQNVTKRNILRLVLEGGDASMEFSPVAGRTNIRFGASDRDVVLSEYTSSGDFLGNFDPPAVVKKLPAGQSQTGGMLVHF